jgi:hypothetical protein
MRAALALTLLVAGQLNAEQLPVSNEEGVITLLPPRRHDDPWHRELACGGLRAWRQLRPQATRDTWPTILRLQFQEDELPAIVVTARRGTKGRDGQ